MSAWLYEFTIDNHRTMTKPVIPQRMSRELHDLWNTNEARNHSKNGSKKGAKKRVDRHVLRLHRGTEHKAYPVRLSYDFLGPGKLETSLAKGWREFVSSNKLRYFDRIRFTLEDSDDMHYRVRIWRGDTEITVINPHIFIENDGTISDVDETEYVPMECLFVSPSFIFTFSKGYHDKPVINVPVKFARQHFEGLADPTDLQIIGRNSWNVTMRFTYRKDKQIATCTIRKGVPELVVGEGIEIGEKVLVELESTEPAWVRLTIRFT